MYDDLSLSACINPAFAFMRKLPACSLAIHPNKILVASGQCAGHDKRDARPHVRIWNSVSLQTQAVVGMNDFAVSVCCISFSKADGGACLVAVDDSPDHVISVWDWQKGENGTKITETKVIYTLEFRFAFNNSTPTSFYSVRLIPSWRPSSTRWIATAL